VKIQYKDTIQRYDLAFTFKSRIQNMLPSSKRNAKKTLDPILTLQVSIDDETAALCQDSAAPSISPVTSLCFLSTNHNVTNAHDDDSESDFEDLGLQCETLAWNEENHVADATSSAHEAAARLSLAGRLVATCQANGNCLIWDLGQRKVLQRIASRDRGPGLLLSRLDGGDDTCQFVYQTRDDAGTVSVHSMECVVSAWNKSQINLATVAKFETHSRTFCAAAPCKGNPNLIVMPVQEHSFAMVRDWRIPPTDPPVAYFHGASGVHISSHPATFMESTRKQGMLMSLAMIESGGTTIACGMESGVVAFHDLAMLSGPRSFSHPCNLSLGSDPVLSLDLASSTAKKHSTKCSILAIAGLAGNAEDLIELAQEDRGRISVIKATMRDDGEFAAQLRTRLPTNDSIASVAHSIKPGAAICRFRHDGRMFAIGGWDKRLRIYDRAVPDRKLAILRGHGDSVNATDWAPDATESGLLATGSSDGQVHIWRCCPSPKG
jgi:WD40 repeat protein